MLPVNGMYRKPADICTALAKERCLFVLCAYTILIARIEGISSAYIQSGIWQVIIYSQVAELVDAARYGNTEGDGISPISVK
jgi:hypothetical protein